MLPRGVVMKKATLLLVLTLFGFRLWGQATSQIQGVVRDETGSSVPGADVKATQTETNVVRTATTSADGTYVLANLPIGPYRLEVSKPGFTTYVQTGIVLQVATNPTIDIALKVGNVSEQVQVEANAALVETQSTNIGSVIENQRILELPLNGRNAAELIQLAGAAVPAGINGTAGFPGGLNVSVGGGLLSGVNYSLDGALYNNPFDAVNLPFPFPDALQEFKVETNSLTADKGTHAAGAVNAVTKSGTNAYHGNLFEFFRNGVLNARNSFAARRDTLKRNQYGGTLGGPIKKDKLFFFVGYQGTKERSDPADRTGFVPTAAMLGGDFSGCKNFPANIIDPATGLPFPNKFIDPSRFSQQSLNIVKLLPKAVGSCGEVPFGPVQKIDQWQTLGRVDYQISDKQTLFFRYMATAYLLPAAFGFSKNLLDSTTGGLDDLAQTAALGHTYVFSPTMVNSFRVAVNRVAVHRFNDDYFSPCDIGVANFHCFVPHQTVVSVVGGPTIGVGTAIEARFIPTYETLSDDVNLVRGSHQIGFGFSGFKYQHSQFANVFSAGAFNFGGLPAGINGGSGVGMADFLLGQVASMTQGSPNTTFTYKNYFSLYAQDTWKVTRRLTLNYGLRWEPFLPQGVNNGAVYNFSWDRFNQGVRSTVFKNAPAGLLYAGDPGFNGLKGVDNRYNQLAPRIGLAFDPKGDGKTSIRASFGMSYDFPNIQIMSTPTTAPPFGNALTNIPGPLKFSDPWSTLGGNPFPGTFGPDAPFIRNGNFVPMDPHAKATTVYSWNFSLQRQIGTSWLVSATYLGTQTIHIWGTEQLNPAQFIPGTCVAGQFGLTRDGACSQTSNTNFRRLATLRNPAEGQFLAYVDMFNSGGTGSYNALLLVAQKRLSQGVSLNANYTWSHCIADINQGSWVGSVGGGLNIADNRRYDRGNCQTQTGTGINQSLDRRHIVNITGVWEAPKFTDKALRWIASDWKLSASYRYLSGAFLTVTTGTDNALNGSAVQRPNLILPNPLATDPAATCGSTAPCQAWLNRAAFGTPAPGTFGNLGRSSVPGPNTWQVDLALSRMFRVRENQTFEIRGEAFNLSNSFRSCIGCVGGLLGGTAVTNRASTQFGQITVADAPRIVQLAAKFVF
jgi:hypothetical protein